MFEQAPHQPAAEAAYAAALSRAAAQTLPVVDLFETVGQMNAAGLGQHVIELYKSWVAYNATDPLLHAVYFNYAVCLSDVGDKTGAINALRAALQVSPDFYQAYINLGRYLEETGHLAPAVVQWMTLVNRLPAITSEALKLKLLALEQIGRVLEASNEDKSAEEALKMSIDLRPNQVEIVQHWIALRMRRCQWPVIEPWDGVTRQDLLRGLSPLSLANLSDDPVFQLAVADRYCRHAIGRPSPIVENLRPRVRSFGPSRRLRIGYLSSDFREHAVGFAMTDVLELHDRDGFEIHAYYCGIERDDATKRRIQAAVDHWTDINPLDDCGAAQRIADDGIDILVDLNGYTKSARTAVFALRPAPIAVNWFGYPGTMGSPYHHYLIADPYIVPKTHEPFYSERVVKLPCYQPNDRRRVVAIHAPTRQDENLPDDALVLCCLNGMQKLTEATFASWMTILDLLPNSVLWLLSGTAETNERLQARAAMRGITPGRLVFAEKKANSDHLARYPLADLFLDTFPYGAHTTAADALWMGVPILTLSGRSFSSRVCGSVVTAAGLADMIVATPEGYVERAVALGRDPDALAMLKHRLVTNRDTCLLFDTPHLVRRLEELYRSMWADFCDGRRPTPRLDNLEIYHAIGLELDLEQTEKLDDADYVARYRAGITRWNETYPVRPDSIIWNGNSSFSAEDKQ